MTDEAQQQINQDQSAAPEPDWEWMLLEVMGHRSHWGRAREEERFGAKMLRIDVPVKGDPAVHGWSTHYYSAPAIFSCTLTDEATVMKKNVPWDAPARLTYREPEDEDEGDGFDIDEAMASETPLSEVVTDVAEVQS